jgi:hypothetical protein
VAEERVGGLRWHLTGRRHRQMKKEAADAGPRGQGPTRAAMRVVAPVGGAQGLNA